MKFAIVENQRLEAQPKLRGKCPTCETPVLAKCGQQKIWHWAHVGIRHCDTWWESETQWHRDWKDQFPIECQEIRKFSSDGQRHIADVQTNAGIVIEFQHSNISIDERNSRENFYGNMVWVVDGLRLKRDFAQFTDQLRYENRTDGNLLGFHAAINTIQILRRWQGSKCIIFLDFGNTETNILPRGHLQVLWRVRFHYRYAEIVPVTYKSFIEYHCGRGELKAFVCAPKPNPPPPPSWPLVGFEKYKLQQQLRRARRRF